MKDKLNLIKEIENCSFEIDAQEILDEARDNKKIIKEQYQDLQEEYIIGNRICDCKQIIKKCKCL
jgi:hypothetical protein